MLTFNVRMFSASNVMARWFGLYLMLRAGLRYWLSRVVLLGTLRLV